LIFTRLRARQELVTARRNPDAATGRNALQGLERQGTSGPFSFANGPYPQKGNPLKTEIAVKRRTLIALS